MKINSYITNIFREGKAQPRSSHALLTFPSFLASCGIESFFCATFSFTVIRFSFRVRFADLCNQQMYPKGRVTALLRKRRKCPVKWRLIHLYPIIT